MIFSKFKMRKGIEEGKYFGWDDLCFGIIRVFRWCGIKFEVIREFIIEVGFKRSDIIISWDNFVVINRKIIELIVNCYFFVVDLILMYVEGV